MITARCGWRKRHIFHCPFSIYHLSFNSFRTQSTGAKWKNEKWKMHNGKWLFGLRRKFDWNEKS